MLYSSFLQNYVFYAHIVCVLCAVYSGYDLSFMCINKRFQLIRPRPGPLARQNWGNRTPSQYIPESFWAIVLNGWSLMMPLTDSSMCDHQWWWWWNIAIGPASSPNVDYSNPGRSPLCCPFEHAFITVMIYEHILAHFLALWMKIVSEVYYSMVD